MVRPSAPGAGRSARHGAPSPPLELTLLPMVRPSAPGAGRSARLPVPRPPPAPRWMAHIRGGIACRDGAHRVGSGVADARQKRPEDGLATVATTEQPASTENSPIGDFGANEWLVEDMYERYLADPTSVD